MTNFEKKTGIKPCCAIVMVLFIISVCFNIFLYNRCVKMNQALQVLEYTIKEEMQYIDTLSKSNTALIKELNKDDSLIINMRKIYNLQQRLELLDINNFEKSAQ